MRNIIAALLFSFFTLPLLAQGAPPQASADQPYTMEYLLQGAMGTSAGILATLPQESLSAAQESSGERSHAVGQNRNTSQSHD